MDRRAVLVTGAGGFIGRRLVKQLEAAGASNVIAWTRSLGDLRDADAVKSVLLNSRPDVIFHLAAQLPGPASESWSGIAGEQSMLANLAYAMPRHCQLIYTGSMAEYGRSGVLRETDQCSPDTGYGCAKLSGTTLALALRSLLGVDVRVARLFGVYGPGEAPTRLLPTLVAALTSGRKAPMSDGRQVRDFVHVDDLCRSLVGLSEAPAENAPDIVNIGTGVGISVRELCEQVAGILDADPRLLEFGALPRRATDQDRLVADTERWISLAEPPPQRWSDASLAAEIVNGFLFEYAARQAAT